MQKVSRRSYWGYHCLTRLFNTIGFSGKNYIAKIVSSICWMCLPTRRKLATKAIFTHLTLSFPEAKQLARASFTENFQSFFESMLIPSFGLHHPRLLLARPDLFEKMQTVDRAIVATSGHFGAWELLAGILGEISETKPQVVVVREYKNTFVREVTTLLRSSRGGTVIGHRKTTRTILHALNRKGIVAFLVDHNTSQREAIFLPFLKEIAAVNIGPAVLAVRSKAMVFPIFLHREGEKYVFWMDEPLDTLMLEGPTESKIITVAKYYTEAVERAIYRTPCQWFWMHNRWKTRPPVVAE